MGTSAEVCSLCGFVVKEVLGTELELIILEVFSNVCDFVHPLVFVTVRCNPPVLLQVVIARTMLHCLVFQSGHTLKAAKEFVWGTVFGLLL